MGARAAGVGRSVGPLALDHAVVVHLVVGTLGPPEDDGVGAAHDQVVVGGPAAGGVAGETHPRHAGVPIGTTVVDGVVDEYGVVADPVAALGLNAAGVRTVRRCPRRRGPGQLGVGGVDLDVAPGVHPEAVVRAPDLDPPRGVVGPQQAGRGDALRGQADGGVRDGVRVVLLVVVVVDRTVDLAVLDRDVGGPDDQAAPDVLVVDDRARRLDDVGVAVRVQRHVGQRGARGEARAARFRVLGKATGATDGGAAVSRGGRRCRAGGTRRRGLAGRGARRREETVTGDSGAVGLRAVVVRSVR